MKRRDQIAMAAVLGVAALAGCAKKKPPPQKAEFAQLLTPWKPGQTTYPPPPICTPDSGGKRFFVEGVILRLPSSITMNNSVLSLMLSPAVGAEPGRTVSVSVVNGRDIDDLTSKTKNVKGDFGRTEKGVSEESLRIHLADGSTVSWKESLRLVFEIEATKVDNELKSCTFHFVEAQKMP